MSEFVRVSELIEKDLDFIIQRNAWEVGNEIELNLNDPVLVLRLPTTAPTAAASSLSMPLVRVAFLFLSLPCFFLFLSSLLPTAALLFRFSVPNLFPVMLCFL